jgi:hypothetical protein
MNQEEKIIFEILENLIILFQNYLPAKILKTEEFQEIKNKMERLRDKK